MLYRNIILIIMFYIIDISGLFASEVNQQPGQQLSGSMTRNSQSEQYTGAHPANKITSGIYLGHQWYIDDRHMMWWDGKPYIPYVSMAVTDVNNTQGFTDFHFSIDQDEVDGNLFNDPGYLNQYTSKVTRAGGTYIVEFNTLDPLINPSFEDAEDGAVYDAARLFDPVEKRKIVASWKPYISAIKKEGLRAVILFNEIDVEYKWPARISSIEYGRILGEYAQEMRNLVGDIPIIYKATMFNFDDGIIRSPVGDGAAISGGLGIDLYASSCKSPSHKAVPALIADLEAKQKKTTLVWMTEFGSAGQGRDGCYWSEFPPYKSKLDMQCQMQTMIDSGATGMFYFGIGEECAGDYRDSNKWFRELRQEMVQRILDRSSGTKGKGKSLR